MLAFYNTLTFLYNSRMNSIKGKVAWYNIQKPAAGDFSWMKKNFKFHPLIMDELKVPSARAKVEAHGDYLYLVYYFPIYDRKEKVSRRSEIDFLITKKAVITITYEEIEVLNDLLSSINPKNRAFDNSLQLIHKIIESLLSFQQRQLAHIREKIDEISNELFSDREKQRERALLEKISYLTRDISQYRVIVRPQKHILESFCNVGGGLLGPECTIYFNDLVGEHLKIIDQLDDYKQAIDDFENTNSELINIKSGQVVKTFTILAFLTFPMMLFATVFSMNAKDTPIVGLPGDFWIIVAIMLVGMIGMFAYFRNKDWI